MASSQYAAALPEFEAARALEPANLLAANNLSVCHLYCCQLSEAVTVLEAQLRADPRKSMHPALVANLANLYQMTAHGGAGSTRPTLERLVMATAPDDFDHTVLTLGQQ